MSFGALGQETQAPEAPHNGKARAVADLAEGQTLASVEVRLLQSACSGPWPLPPF